MINKLRAQAFLRIALGLFFLVPGLSKLANPAGITGMLLDLGFPLAGLFAWILLLSEIIFGASLIVGHKVKFAVWPLFVILLVALLLVAIPGFDLSNTPSVMIVLWHLVGLAGLMSIKASGAGKLFN